MEKSELIDRLTYIFRTTFDEDALVITDELSAGDVDGWDSLSHMLLIVEVERSFSIKFKLKDLNKMKNVGDMIDLIISKI